ncbi:MAG: hypothetical protein L0H41_08055 [Microlunatus sp.]|nr:hypothetical protein [Microlunatus sp.]MDN5803058.1 hypothetical protein [Microlunatus sp.]
MPANRTGQHLAIYLRNHEAGAQAGMDLFKRAISGQREQTYVEVLRQLRVDVREDLRALRQLMRTVHVRPDPLLATALRVGERLGRWKPNGAVLRRSPLSDLVEIEALLDAVGAKRNGWLALQAADLGEVAGQPDLTELVRRADQQTARLAELHQLVSARVLAQ